ncbi:hypothetical protein B4N89_20690 [Embleya scabrispora]|uniref:Centromere-binding protein ParB C-terminal domain-containing protein n=1 Tax=Embleya scabrispora TaxID=159449 RepID=A0A1T3P1Q5_9ACTN|nr:hypothetical protein [Embleya scabrispora]OPC83033.1 hypothetical protein B4N89_20690 [Embleya scabrispora]
MAKLGRPATGETPIRRFRSGAIWDAAKAKADIEGRTMTDVLNDALRKYAATPPKPPTPPAN